MRRRRVVMVGIAAAVAAAPLIVMATQSGSSVAAVSGQPYPPNNATVRIAGPQHFCATNGITCTEPALTWDEYKGFDAARKAGGKIWPYIGHDEPATLFYSNQPGSGNDATYQMVLPKDPPTPVKQDGSGGVDSFQLHPTFWLGMVMC